MQRVYRILDANFNRAREGLRVVEEVVRFVLSDPHLTARLKHLRHRLSEVQQMLPGGEVAFLAERDVFADVGAVCVEEVRTNYISYIDLVLANFKRVEEAIRVLEECTKFVCFNNELKEMRFSVYALEQEIIELVKLRDSCFSGEKRGIDYSLYVITGEEFSRGKNVLQIATEAIQGGARVVQLREKKFSTCQLVKTGKELRRLTREHGVTFIVNDRVDVALAVDADGVHLGQNDLPLLEARRILGASKIIGISTHTLEQALRAQEQGADYIGVGPVFETTTKKVSSLPGLELLYRVAEKVRIPKIAIGGINIDNVAQVIAAGADGVAVITAVVSAPDISAAAAALSAEIARARALQC